MKNTIISEDAHKILDKYINKKEFLLHMRETEVIMINLAKYFNENEELWGATGLLHDLDYEIIGDDFKKHGITTIEILQKEGYEIPEMFQAILAHTEGLGFCQIKRTSRLDYALSATENLSGFLVAVALMRPTKLDDMEVKSVTKKLKDKTFASKVNRDFINDIEKTGLDKNTFIQIAIDSVSSIKNEIGF